MERIAIVTGSSSGFGLLTCIELAKEGYQVIATMRNMEKNSHFARYINDRKVLDRIQSFPLDVTDPVSIQKFEENLACWNQVDLLVNNAGFALGGFAEELKIDAYRSQFETNVFGVMAVTKAVLPKMRSQKEGKIINISSVSGKIGFPGLSAYTSSKHALEGYTESLRLEVKPLGIDAVLIEPGAYQTNIWAVGMEEIKKSSKKQSPYREYKERVISMMENDKEDQGNPRDVAKLIVHLAGKKEIKNLRYPIGNRTNIMITLKKILPWNIWEKQVLRKIFK